MFKQAITNCNLEILVRINAPNDILHRCSKNVKTIIYKRYKVLGVAESKKIHIQRVGNVIIVATAIAAAK